MNFKDTLVASLVPIFLGFGFVIAKPAFESFPPILLMGIRFTFAASLLIWWFPIPKGYLKRIFAASLVANTLQYSITYSGLDLIDASAAVILSVNNSLVCYLINNLINNLKAFSFTLVRSKLYFLLYHILVFL